MPFEISYEIDSDSSAQLIEAIRTEQTIEFPLQLAPTWIQQEVVGQVVRIEDLAGARKSVTISYDDRVVGQELPQLLNLLWGNISLFPKVLITAVKLPDSFLASLKGPRFGVAGMRERLGIKDRPFLMTALKPMGCSTDDLASMASTLVEGGIDIIKDDHNLANQPWSLWQDRVEIISTAVAKANREFDRSAIYAPSLNRPTEELFQSARFARESGAGALLLLPGICGFDTMRAIADDDSVALPILSHPALMGSFVMNPTHGISHELTFATLLRLSGADFTIFPNHGGRFNFTQQACEAIVRNCSSSISGISSISPALAGGMTIARVPEIIRDFGLDITLLIGGALHDGDLLTNTERLVESVKTSSAS